MADGGLQTADSRIALVCRPPSAVCRLKKHARPAPEPVARIHRTVRPSYAVRAAASAKSVISRASDRNAHAMPFSAIACSTIFAPSQ